MLAGWDTTPIPWSQVTDIRPDLDSRWASHPVAHLSDGRQVPLVKVPLDARDDLLAWAPEEIRSRLGPSQA